MANFFRNVVLGGFLAGIDMALFWGDELVVRQNKLDQRFMSYQLHSLSEYERVMNSITGVKDLQGNQI